MMKYILLFAVAFVTGGSAVDRLKHLESFEAYPGKLALIPGEEIIKNVRNTEDCARSCRMSKGFKCQGFEYCQRARSCVLLSKHISDLKPGEVTNTEKTECSHYAIKHLESFEAYPGKLALIPGEKIIRDVRNTEECARLCRLSKGFKCQGFEFCQKRRSCVLHSKHISDLKPGEVINTEKTDCIHYAIRHLESFEAYPGKLALIPGEEIIKDVRNTEDCARSCRMSKGFKCQGFEYCQRARSCVLHSKHISDLKPGEVANTEKTECSHYAIKHLESFGAYPGKLALIPGEEIIKDVRNTEDCARLCRLSHDFKCQGFEYCQRARSCVLHSKHISDLKPGEVANTEKTDCTHYAIKHLESFEAYPGKLALIPGEEVIRDVRNTEECARLCHMSKSFKCQGFEYCEQARSCVLHSKHISNLAPGQVAVTEKTKCIHYAKKEQKNENFTSGHTSTKSECEKHRERAIDHESIMKLIPKCKENGDYEALQCYKDSKFCVCYDKNGHAASPILSNLKECGCFLERKRKIDSNHENAFIPQCENTGKFAKKQCWDFNDSCWCVDENGKQKGDIVADGNKLNCE